MSIKDDILKKVFSGRYFAAVSFVFTQCLVMIICTILMAKGKMDLDVYKWIYTGFSAMVLYIVKSYFDRSDRDKPGGDDA